MYLERERDRRGERDGGGRERGGRERVDVYSNYFCNQLIQMD